MSHPAIAPDVQRAIRADYLLRGPDGKHVYQIAEIAHRHSVSPQMVSKLARRRGLSRYLTRAA